MCDMAYRSRGEGAADGGRGRFQVAAGGDVEERGDVGVVIVLVISRHSEKSSSFKEVHPKKPPVASDNAEVELWFLFPLKTETFSCSVNEYTNEKNPASSPSRDPRMPTCFSGSQPATPCAHTVHSAILSQTMPSQPPSPR